MDTEHQKSAFELETQKPEPIGSWITESVIYATMLATFIIFILVLFCYAMFAAFKMKRLRDVTYEEFLIGGRTIGLTVTSLSLAVTYLGGSNVGGIIDIIVRSGFVWTVSVVGIAMGPLLGGLVFARPMYKAQYMTMLEPFKEQYGESVPAILFVLIAIFEILLAASLLSSIGAGICVVMDLDASMVVLVVGIFTCLYTAYGGLYAVAYSGIIQLVLSQVLWVPAIVAYNHEAVNTNTSTDAATAFPMKSEIALWIDIILTGVLGGTVSQVFYQRILSCKSAGYSQVASVLASFACFIITVPVAFLGYIAIKTDWIQTSHGRNPEYENYLFSLVLSTLCPKSVAVMGILAAAAVSMSSIDASFLSAASLFVHHIYLPIRSCCRSCCKSGCCKSQVSDLEKVWASRIAVIMFAVFTCLSAVTVSTIFGILMLFADLCYIILFPQLTCVLFIPLCNVWGSLSGIVFGLLFRVLAGDPAAGLPTVLPYPGYDSENQQQRFPHRTFVMILSFIPIILVSFVSRMLIVRRAHPEMTSGEKKAAWFGKEGGYKRRAENDQEVDLSDKSDTQL